MSNHLIIGLSDIDKVEAIVMRCIADHESQSRNAEKARELLMASLVNDRYSYFGLLDFDYNSLLNSIIENSQSNAIADLERIAEAMTTDRIIGREI
mgnify:CR=1 FL=1